MLNIRKNRTRRFFKDIEKKSEAEKMRLMWFCVIFFMSGMFGLWIWSAKNNLGRLGGSGVDFSSVPAFPEEKKAEVGATMDESGKKIGQYITQDLARSQDVGDKYIKDNGILADEEFSSLKFMKRTEEEKAILLEYGQYYKDIPVAGAGMMLSLDKETGTVNEKERNLMTGISLVVDPKVSLKEAEKIATENAGPGYTAQGDELLIMKSEGDFYLAWKITLSAEDYPGTKDIFVGAQRGSIIAADPRDGQEDDQTSNIAG